MIGEADGHISYVRPAAFAVVPIKYLMPFEEANHKRSKEVQRLISKKRREAGGLDIKVTEHFSIMRNAFLCLF
jgi:hypothetical protein